MADRGDIHERMATLERMAEDNRAEIKGLRDWRHSIANLLTAHGNDIEYMRPVVMKLDALSHKAIGIVIGLGLSSGAAGAVAVKLLWGHS